jgi:hypothetical protein
MKLIILIMTIFFAAISFANLIEEDSSESERKSIEMNEELKKLKDNSEEFGKLDKKNNEFLSK